MQLHSINTEQGLYVIKACSGFTCYGFEVLNRKALAVAEWLGGKPRYTGRPIPAAPSAPGTAEHFAWADEMLERGAEFNRMTGEQCPCDLVPALIGCEGYLVSADYFCDPVRFYVGKSTGWMPAHLMILKRGSSGGEAIIPDQLKNVRLVGKP